MNKFYALGVDSAMTNMRVPVVLLPVVLVPARPDDKSMSVNRVGDLHHRHILTRRRRT